MVKGKGKGTIIMAAMHLFNMSLTLLNQSMGSPGTSSLMHGTFKILTISQRNSDWQINCACRSGVDGS
jgi:hypothetical protein